MAALTVSASMVLFEFWLNSLPNPQFLRNLKELRDDLLFERVNYEEGLTAYRLLVEGYSLRDLAGPVVQKMFSIVDNLELRERKTVSLLAVLENEVSGDIDDWTPERIRKCIEGLGSIEHVVDEQLSELAEFGECIENLSAETASNSHKINSADQTTMLAVEFGARLDSMSARSEDTPSEWARC
ncbi:MAG: hypothetical protein IPK98_03650 [Chloracidobacterium sp.]|nr:hypothetical protein [Chloracidobacterium sp.]